MRERRAGSDEELHQPQDLLAALAMRPAAVRSAIRRAGRVSDAGNSPAKGVGPSRYFCAEALQPRDDQILAGLVRQFEKGQYEPEFDWDTIRREREIDIAEGIDSGWTGVPPHTC